jgi:hypothetical protein
MFDRDTPTKILLRGLVYVIVFYAIVQAEQFAVGRPFEWFGETQFFVAVFIPAIVTLGTLIRYRNVRPPRQEG